MDKFIPTAWKYFFVINCVLCLTISPNATLLVHNTHLHPILLQSLVNFHMALALNESYFLCIVASYLLASWDHNTLHKFNWSSKNVTLVCHSLRWCRMWYFHHSPGGCRSFLEHLRSSPNFSMLSSFSASVSIVFHYNQTISDLVIALITIITQRWFRRFVHINHRRAFISFILTHI